MGRFEVFSDEEREQIRYGLRNCSLYDCGSDADKAVVFSLLEEISGSEIVFISTDIRKLMRKL